jgi:ubiquitin C-terminal hydrolase
MPEIRKVLTKFLLSQSYLDNENTDNVTPSKELFKVISEAYRTKEYHTPKVISIKEFREILGKCF